MPVFHLGLSDGRTISVEADTQQAAVDHVQDFISKGGQPAPQASQAPTTAGGLAKNFGAGIARGALGLAGLPGDVLHHFGTGSNIPGTEELSKNVQDTFGQLPEATNTPERYAQSIGSMFPTIAGGPEGIAARLLTRAVLPGVASEALGEATEGTPYEGVARAGGAALTPAIATKIGAMKAAAKLGKAATDADLYLDAGDQGYKDARAAGVAIKPGYVRNGIANRINDFSTRGLDDADIAPVANRVANDLMDRTEPQTVTPKMVGLTKPAPPYTQEADPLSIDELQAARAKLRAGAKSITHPEDRAASMAMIDTIDELMSNLRPAHVLAGDADLAARSITTASKNYAAGMELQRLQDLRQKASDSAASSNSGHNFGNQLRSKTAVYINNPKASKGLSEAEKATLRQKVVNGTLGTNIMRAASNLLGGGGGLGSTLLGLGAGALSEHEGVGPEGFALPLLGIGLRNRANAATAAQFDRVLQMRAARSPLGVQQQAMVRSRMAPYAMKNQIVPGALRALDAIQAQQ